MSSAPHSSRLTFYRRITASVPVLVTIIVHVVLIAIAGYFVVSEQIIGKKKTFEATAASESIAQKQVEHRLQVARKGGGSASSSPVSAARIFSTASDSLQMPAMPDLPSVGASSLSGMGFGAGMGGVGAGTGYNTGLGTSGGLGRGFMSMSFLGVTNQRASKIVFVVDVGRDLLDIRKGGFAAFAIIREEIMKLISLLPPSAEFNVVLFERQQWSNSSVAALGEKLVPATVANKEEFFKWIRPVNAAPEKIGLGSASGHRVRWTPKELANAGLDPTLRTPEWSRALHFALEMEPDVVYVISGIQGELSRAVSDEELARRKKAHDEKVEELKARLVREGIDIKQVNAARNRALAKARADLDAVNSKLKAKGKSPLIVTDINRVFQADFQAELKRLGYSITLDRTGWTDKEGKPLVPSINFSGAESVEFNEMILHVAKLQRALLKERAVLNYFLFVGPNETPKTATENLGKLSGKNGGKFELLTTKRLQELAAKDEDPK